MNLYQEIKCMINKLQI
uniref:Uncharacterized protein n=1 Tax=Anguilla anguilla TaxID=7936 RepID=A0A0E9UCP9_ANGAN